MWLPNDEIAIDIGTRREEAIAQSQSWASLAHKLGNMAWDYCELNDWPRLELTFSGMKFNIEDKPYEDL